MPVLGFMIVHDQTSESIGLVKLLKTSTYKVANKMYTNLNLISEEHRLQFRRMLQAVQCIFSML